MKIGLRGLNVLLATGLATTVVVSIGGTIVRADERGLRAETFTFVGQQGDCGGPGSDPFNLTIPYPAGSRIVTAEWLGGLGLPDSDTLLNASQPPYSATSDPLDNPNKRNRRQGLLLSKNGPTEDCSAAGATIKGLRSVTVTAGFTLGFDVRNGLHCSGGAPRFNLVTRNPITLVETFHFVGSCTNGTVTPALQDPTSWSTARFDVTAANGGAFPPVAVGDRIRTLDLIFDEGTTSTAVPGNVLAGAGIAIVDNIYINGAFIRQGDDDGHDKDR